MMHSKTLRALLSLACISLVWGYNWVIMKRALTFAGPFAFAAQRSLLGGLFLLAVLAIVRRPIFPASFLGAFVLGILQTCGFVGLVTWALVTGTAGKTAVLVYTMPFWVLVLAWPLLGERIRGLQWWTVGLVLFGLFCIIQPWSFAHFTRSILLALLAGFCWALSGLWIKHLQNRGHTDRLPLTAWQLLLGSLPLLLIAIFIENHPTQWSLYYIWALSYNTILATAIAWFLFLYAMQNLSAGMASMGTLATPGIGLVSAWLRFGETPGPYESLGIIAIFLGLFVLSWDRFHQ